MKRIIKLTESDLTRLVKRVINEGVQFDTETLLNKDTSVIRVFAGTSYQDEKPLKGAIVEWPNASQEKSPKIKVTLPNGEMKYNEYIKVYVILKPNGKVISRFTLTSSEIKNNSSRGLVSKTQQANVQGKQIFCMFKWNPNGITVKADSTNAWKQIKAVASKHGG